MRFISSAKNHALPKAQAIALLLFAFVSYSVAARDHKITVTHSDFHGWNAIVVRNDSAQVVIVPDIGRVMKFDLLDQKGQIASGPFWNNPAIDKSLPSDAEGWKNYGGDKAWPAPQSDWPKIAARAWPPPAGFDSTPFSARIRGSQVELVSQPDSIYGIRVRRTITLDAHKPELEIRTVYEKTQGAPVQVGVWTITQLESPERAFILLPPHSQFPEGYVNLLPTPPNDVKVEGRLLSLTRGLEKGAKIGNDGNAILWVGQGPDLLLETKAPALTNKSEWPEQSRTEIYTNPGDKMKYVEFELMNRLENLKPGQKVSLEATYTLIPRTQSDPAAEAKKVFRLP